MMHLSCTNALLRAVTRRTYAAIDEAPTVSRDSRVSACRRGAVHKVATVSAPMALHETHLSKRAFEPLHRHQQIVYEAIFLISTT